MHKTSYEIMQKFRDQYVDLNKNYIILDIGSCICQTEELSYKDLFGNNKNWAYIGLDLYAGKNVDVVVTGNSYKYPFESNYFDVVISGQTLEHCEYLRAWFNEINRVLKPGGLACIIAPGAGKIHETNDYKDFWRVMPSGLRSLVEGACFEILKIDRRAKGKWHDTYCIIKKK